MATTDVTVHHRATRARRMPAQKRREQILDAAVSVFAQRGYTAAGTAEIAAAAGIGEPTIYRYFAGKRDLYMAALQRADQEVRDNWERIASENGDPLNALLLIGAWYRQTLRERPRIIQLRSRAIAEPPHRAVGESAKQTYLEFRDFVENLFIRARDEGRIRADSDVRTLTWQFMALGALLDLSQQMNLQDQLTDADVVALAQVILAGRFT